MLDNYRQVQGENSAYRKGLVLGLTMAEIMLLLLFALMLIIGSSWAHAKRELASRDERIKTFELALGRLGPDFKLQDFMVTIDRMRRENEANAAEIARLRPLEQNAKIIEDILRDIRRSRDAPMTPQQLAERLKSADALEAALGGLSVKDAVEKLKDAAAITAVLGANSSREAAEKVRITKAVLEAIPGISEKQAAELATALPDILRDIENKPGDAPGEAVRRYIRELATAKGQVAQLSESLRRLGRGNEFPSCWVTSDGKTESIFDIFFNEAGIEVRERSQPHRAAERAALPLSAIQYGRSLSTGEFRQQVRQLYDWSVENKCRFYIVRFTRRGVATVDHVNEVGKYFYPDSSIRQASQ